MDFHIGASINDSEGEHLGKLTHVIVHPETKQIAQIVLEEHGLTGRDILIPIEDIGSATRDKIVLTIAKADTDKLQDFLVAHFDNPEPSAFSGYTWSEGALVSPAMMPMGVAPGMEYAGYVPPVETEKQITVGDADIQPGTDVLATDGRIGTVDDILIDDQTKGIRAFAVRRGWLFHKDVEVGIEHIESVGPEGISLKLSKAELAALPG